MQELLYEAYNQSSDFVAAQIEYLEGITPRYGEDHVKQYTLSALKKLLKCALAEECNEFNQEKHEAEYLP